MKHGGKRPGAGRKKGYAALSAEKAREIIAKRLSEALEPIVEALTERAISGDVRAARELFDRAFGRPSEAEKPKEAAASVIFQIPKEIAQKHNMNLVEGDPID